MKKMKWFQLGALLLASTGIFAQDFLLTSPVGYGAAATGAGTSTAISVVENSGQLSSALTAGDARTIIIKGNIEVNYLSVLVTNKTILGLPGSSLFTNDQTAGASGILYFKPGSTNIIMRNVTLIGPGAYDTNGRDLLCLDGAKNCWIDHCDFQDGMDDNFDIKGLADNISVSWCKFGYNKVPKAGGSGGTDDHRFSNLIGSGSTDAPTDKQFSITWMNCWWAQGCVERQVRARNAQLHMLNCYWNSSVSKAVLGLEDGITAANGGLGTTCYVEGCVFECTGTVIKATYGGTPDVTCVDVLPAQSNLSTPVTKPSYTYTALAASDVKSVITNTCGAGATLVVTEAGAISTGTCASEIKVAKETLFSCVPTVVENTTELLLTSDNASTISVYDLTGRKVKEVNANSAKVTLDLSTLNSGIYMITVISNNQIQMEKIVKK